MSTEPLLDDGLVVWLSLDSIEDGIAADSSGNGHAAVVEGAPRVVPDATLTRCMEFDGLADALVVPFSPEFHLADELTFSAWVRPRGARRLITALFQYPRFADRHRRPYHDYGMLLVANRPNARVAGEYGGVIPDALPVDEWTHVALSWHGPTGRLTYFLNGVAVDTRTTDSRWIAYGTEHPLLIGRHAGGSAFFQGSIASVRLYRRALDVEEINRIADDDLHGRTTYEEEHPLAFAVVDDDDEARLAITDEGSPGRNLHVAVVNRSPFIVEFVEPDPSVNVVDSAHLELRFRPGTLSGESLARIAPVDREWHIATSIEDDGTHVLHLTHRLSRVVLPGHRLAVTLAHVSADALLGARNTRVSLRYRNVRFQESGVPCHGYGERLLAIHNRRGRRTTPFRFGVFEPRVVMNDSETPTSLTAYLGNGSKSTDLELRAGVAATRFVLSFDCGDGPWDLGSIDEVAAINVSVAGFDVDPRPHGETPEWIITPRGDLTLGPGEKIELQLEGIVSSGRSGPARVQLRYDNLPGHWDGELVTTIEKSAIRYSAVEDAAGESMTVPGTVEARTLTSTGVVNDVDGPVVPDGVIVMWSGSAANVPAGWVLCNRENGTPDLRGRFVVGVDPRLAAAEKTYSTVRNTGGADTVTLSEGQMPTHGHAVTLSEERSHTHKVPGKSVTLAERPFAKGSAQQLKVAVQSVDEDFYADSRGGHTHPVTIASSGEGRAHENRPPFFVLAFIMKKATS